MILEHDDKIFQIIFKKVRRTATQRKKKVQLIDTQCSIIVKNNLSDLWSEAYQLSSGESKQYIGDKYSKVIGKKYALLDALRSFYYDWAPLDSQKAEEKGFPRISESFTKAFRTALWKKFNETFGAWR